MDIEAVMDEMATALRTIGSLQGRTFAYPPDSVTPPAALVGYPEIDYQQSYQRGLDILKFPVWVVVSTNTDRAARAALGPYLAGSGSTSVKAAIDGGTYTECDVAVVTDGRVTSVRISDIEYLAAEFTVDIYGSGE